MSWKASDCDKAAYRQSPVYHDIPLVFQLVNEYKQVAPYRQGYSLRDLRAATAAEPGK
jgi:hypothetical protein